MSTTTPARHPAGVRTGGQFAATARAEAPLDLGVPDAPQVDAVNGLVPRLNAAGRWYLADQATGKPVLRDAQRARGSHATLDDAMRWAEHTYPLVVRVADKLERRHPVLTPTCPDCATTMVHEVDDERPRPAPVWVCPVCDAPAR
ncbi:hypothetical protein CHO01_35950 [Cellulomonas hominis]|uniref:Uncharacterized protein n=1 Tax=Cellulomonas hominis TaxID=156981 RepID=A0A511FGS9_9CELL|nr:hypothetical protein [Cellulomonas hominis]MBB5474824.1 hypothetical protein [Cellulomonas hominis]NKY05660.1 hypothetical protein [Cellulomonas hominis]GEL48479.1 hypothetical protein CHO01_35950 [Cellulomonas hominis]